MHDGMVANVSTKKRRIYTFSNIISLNQDSAFSSYLFASIIDNLSRHIQDKVSWCLLLADNIV